MTSIFPKVLAMKLVKESDLSKQEKLDLLKFIKDEENLKVIGRVLESFNISKEEVEESVSQKKMGMHPNVWSFLKRSKEGEKRKVEIPATKLIPGERVRLSKTLLRIRPKKHTSFSPSTSS